MENLSQNMKIKSCSMAAAKDDLPFCEILHNLYTASVTFL